MGNTKLQLKLGKPEFDNEPMVTANDTNLCFEDDKNATSKCILITEECSFWVSIFSALINGIGLEGKFIKCPLEYYNCTNNIIEKNKIVSGYYINQALPDGTKVDKPPGKGKCSHGGILDGSTFIKAEGGMNKDSGYTVFSPHANLHMAAAKLAINHTELFFKNIRDSIGDAEFNKFLSLTISNETLAKAGDQTCTASFNSYPSILIYLFFIANIFSILN